MEGQKLEPISGATSEPPPKTMSGVEDETVSRPKSLLKVQTTSRASSETDGADEKMLPEGTEDGGTAVKMGDILTPNEKQNGDAKLDIGDVKSAFVGLTKEELMKYANDPFWVRLRWFLFITFWGLWLAMLLGAVMIIYAAPKCDPPPPRTWWQEGPLIEAPSDASPSDLKQFKDNGIQGVIAKWPEMQDTYSDIDKMDDFVKFTQTAKQTNLNVILELDPSHSLKWFNQSENNQAQYSDYYIWKAPFATNGTGFPQSPNNWLNPKNQSSWIFSKQRKQFYYAPYGRPHLNFRNINVTQEFIGIIEKFIKFGVNGVKLNNVANLLVDPKFENEPIKPNNPGFIHTDYGFYTHSKTENLAELGELLNKFRKVVKERTDNAPFMVGNDLGNIESYKFNNSLIVDLPQQSPLFNKLQTNAVDIVKRLDSIFKTDNIDWPLWKLNDNKNDVLDIVTFLLPGTPLVGQNNMVNGELLKIRNSASIMRGTFKYRAIQNNSVFAFGRVTSGNPGILVAFNPTESSVVVDFPMEFAAVSDEVTVQLFSSNYNETDITVNVKLNARAVPISPHSAIVLSYVPKKEEK